MTTVPATNRPLFQQSAETVLERGLHSMTLACDALTQQNNQLRKQVDSLTNELNRLKEKAVLNP